MSENQPQQQHEHPTSAAGRTRETTSPRMSLSPFSQSTTLHTAQRHLCLHPRGWHADEQPIVRIEAHYRVSWNSVRFPPAANAPRNSLPDDGWL